MEHILFNNNGDITVIHRCYKDHNQNIYTQESCNYDDMKDTDVQPITFQTMIDVVALTDGNKAIMCANCFPIEGL